MTGVEALTPDMGAEQVLEIAASAEQRLTHPVAEAIVRYAAARGVSPGPRGRWHYEIGMGVRAQFRGAEVLIGSDRLLEREGVDLAPAAAGPNSGRSHVYVAIGGSAASWPMPIRCGTRPSTCSPRSATGTAWRSTS